MKKKSTNTQLELSVPSLSFGVSYKISVSIVAHDSNIPWLEFVLSIQNKKKIMGSL